MTRIFLIRHAEAEGNIFRRAHGHYDGQIIGRGYAQIERLKARFKNERIDAVYSSDLSRTRVTASAVYEPHKLQLHTTERLREVGMGAWEDVPWGDIEYSDAEMSRYFNIDPGKWLVAGGEEFHHVQKRMKECISEIAARHDGETVAVFSHGFAIRALICAIHGIQSSEITKVPYFDNTAVSLLRCDNDGMTVEYQGDNSHLSNQYSTFANQTWWRSKRERVFENLRFMQPAEERDFLLLESLRKETGGEYKANKEYTAILDEEAVGIVGLGGDSVEWAAVDEQRAGSGLLAAGSGQRTAESSQRAASIGWIDYIYVRPEFRKNNFGVQLLGQAVSVFRGQRCERLRISIPNGSPTTGFFEKFECVRINEEKKQCIMEKNIRNW